MAATHRSAMGKAIDMDMLRLANEGVIAVGNMRTNARGDELGPGGKIVKTRSEIMSEYHALNTPVADNAAVAESIDSVTIEDPNRLTVPDVPYEPPVSEVAPDPNAYVKPRGSFADAVAKETEVKQELLKPLNANKGIQRI